MRFRHVLTQRCLTRWPSRNLPTLYNPYALPYSVTPPASQFIPGQTRNLFTRLGELIGITKKNKKKKAPIKTPSPARKRRSTLKDEASRKKSRAPAESIKHVTVQPKKTVSTDAVAKPRRTPKKRTSKDTLKETVSRASLFAINKNHHDLKSFLEYAEQKEMRTETTIYRGTHYEYTVAETLKTYNFTLHRTGRANDLGIDLLGEWVLPMQPSELKVVIQCKASKTAPRMVRELEGACHGAPAGWRGDGVMAFLVASTPPTKGVREAIQRSEMPMGFIMMNKEGAIQQFTWNHAATEARLTGLAATLTRKPRGKQAISLHFMDELWRTGPAF